MQITEVMLRKELIENELTITELANKLDIPRHRISYYVRKYNLSETIKLITENKHNFIDRKYDRLTVKEYAGMDAWNKKEWKCECECGRIVIVGSSSLTQGHNRSCGCLRKELTGKRLWQGHGEIGKNTWSDIQRNAKSRDYEFSITIEYAWELFLSQNRECALTGIGITLYRHYRDKIRHTASLDRIDNKKGYVEGNVQWVHKHVNICKHTYPNEEFINICNLVAKKHPR